MAEHNKKRRVIKKSETVRERANKAAETPPKKRRVRTTVGKANRPLKAVGRGAIKFASPFAFLLWPFKTRVGRFIGRILGKVLFISYFQGSWKELRQVTWPNRTETIKLTIAVFIFAVLFALLIAVVDYGLDKVFKQLLLN